MPANNPSGYLPKRRPKRKAAIKPNLKAASRKAGPFPIPQRGSKAKPFPMPMRGKGNYGTARKRQVRGDEGRKYLGGPVVPFGDEGPPTLKGRARDWRARRRKGKNLRPGRHRLPDRRRRGRGDPDWGSPPYAT